MCVPSAWQWSLARFLLGKQPFVGRPAGLLAYIALNARPVPPSSYACAVAPPQTPPGAVTSYTVAQNTRLVINALGGSPPLFTDPSGVSLTLGVAAQPDAAHGHVDVNTTDGTVTFVPAVGFVGNATFVLSASDGWQSANVTVTVVVGEWPLAGGGGSGCCLQWSAC